MGKDIPRNSGQQPKCTAKACRVACNTHFGIGHGGRHDVKRHIERAAHIAKAQSRLGSINRPRLVAAGCKIDKVTSAEIAFAIFTGKHNLPMAVGDEFGLLAKKMWCTPVPVAPPGGGKNTNYRFSRFFVRSVPLFRSLMLTPMFTQIARCPGRLCLVEKYTGHVRTPCADMPRTMGHVRTRTYFYILPNIFNFCRKLYSCNMHSMHYYGYSSRM